MNKDIINNYLSKIQHPKLKGTCLSIVLLSQLILPFLFPFLKELGLSNPPILKISAKLLLLLIVLAIFYAIEWFLKKTSDLKCPYCGSFRFFVFDSKSTGKNIPKGYIRRHYECKDCGKKEKIFVKPIETSHSASSFN